MPEIPEAAVEAAIAYAKSTKRKSQSADNHIRGMVNAALPALLVEIETRLVDGDLPERIEEAVRADERQRCRSDLRERLAREFRREADRAQSLYLRERTCQENHRKAGAVRDAWHQAVRILDSIGLGEGKP